MCIVNLTSVIKNSDILYGNDLQIIKNGLIIVNNKGIIEKVGKTLDIKDTVYYSKIIENKEYKFDCGKYVITDEHLLEVINFIENEGLRYYLGIKSTNYGNSTDYDDNGSFVIAWN